MALGINMLNKQSGFLGHSAINLPINLEGK